MGALTLAIRRVFRWLLMLLRPALFIVIVVAVLGYFVLPTRTFMDQRVALADTRTELEGMHSANETLEERIDKLQSLHEIERLALSLIHI